jgi:hypothetical protein
LFKITLDADGADDCESHRAACRAGHAACRGAAAGPAGSLPVTSFAFRARPASLGCRRLEVFGVQRREGLLVDLVLRRRHQHEIVMRGSDPVAGPDREGLSHGLVLTATSPSPAGGRTCSSRAAWIRGILRLRRLAVPASRSKMARRQANRCQCRRTGCAKCW